MRASNTSSVASECRSKLRRIARKPTGASRSTPSVPRKSRFSLGSYRSQHRDAAVCRNRPQRHPGAGNEGLQEHVAGASRKAVASAGGMEAGLHEGATGLHRAGDLVLGQISGGAQGDQRGRCISPVSLLQRALATAEANSIHVGQAACSAVVGSIIARTVCALSHGNPPALACSAIVSTSSAM